MLKDPGLQPERTALAWRRTALAIAVNGGLLVRAAMERHSTVVGIVAILVLLASVAVFVISTIRRVSLMRSPDLRGPHPHAVAFVLGAVWLACAAAVFAELA